MMFGEQMGIVNWRQVAQDSNGWRRASREVLSFLGYRNHKRIRINRMVSEHCEL
jgi:hypothetical protein